MLIISVAFQVMALIELGVNVLVIIFFIKILIIFLLIPHQII